MDAESDLIENIKACRTCGIHYVTPSKHQLKHLFQSSLEHSEIMAIRLELSQWSVEVAENDGLPQYICNTCIHKFEQVFELRAMCINAQSEFRKFYVVPNGNISNVKIKTELPDPDEEQAICDFIYVDDLSDEEYDGATPLNFPHIPIKEEIIEAANIPQEELEQPTNIVKCSSNVQKEELSSQITEVIPQNEGVIVDQTTAVSQIATEEVKCKLCHHSSLNQEEHEHHMQSFHETRNFECHICGKEFKNSTASRLKFHMKWHTLNKHVKCNLCGFICNSKGSLREHKRANHLKVSCKICGRGVLSKKMKSHLRHHELLKYSCEYCTEAFATENERENHIWQIHANEDNDTSPNLISIFPQTCSQIAQQSSIEVPQQQISCQEPQNEVLYKFVCAHCEHRFIEQIDLETHVNEEHRIQSHAAPSVPQDTVMAMQEQDVSKNDINMFEEYDNVPVKDSSLCNTILLEQDDNSHSSSSTFLELSENTPIIGKLRDLNMSHKEQENSESEDEANSTLPSYIDSSLNTFACAKCSETFVTIEQLRQHYNEHLATDTQHQQPQNVKPKLKFKCDWCEKSFDLKFSLNRHLKKHKYAPI